MVNMSMPLVIKMAFTDSVSSYSDEYNKILDFIESEIKDAEIYKIKPKKFKVTKFQDKDGIFYLPSISGAGFDIYLIIHTIGSIASIASLLWLAYKEYIESKHPKGGLYISVGEEEDKVDLHVGKDFKDKDIFIKTFTQKISKIMDSKDVKHYYNNTILEIKSSDVWEKN